MSSKQNEHEQLVERMRTAGREAQEQDPYEPSFDWSFKEKRHGYKSSGKFMRIAAIVIIFLLGLNVLLLNQSKNSVYSDQSILHRLYVGTFGLFIDSNSDVEPNDVKATITTDNWDDLSKIKRKIKQLHIPEYMPEGFEFTEFNSDEFYSGNYMGYYIFSNNTQENITIVFNYYQDDEIVYNDTTHSELIELDDRVIYITVDDIEQIYYANVITDYGTLEINGINSREELIEIACNLKQ